MPIIQAARGPYICNSVTFYTCIKDLRPPNTITSQCVNMWTYHIPKVYLDKLKQDYKNFTLASFESGGTVTVAELSDGTKMIKHTTGIIIFQNFRLEG